MTGARPGSPRPAARGDYAVSTPHRLASEAALDVLAAGGNAVDAALTAAAVCVVVQPFSSSLAGVGWAVAHDAGTGRTRVLECCGTVPGALDVALLPADRFGLVDVAQLERGDRALLSSLTPCLAPGWAALLATAGSWPLDRVLAPAIELANEGFAVSPLLHSMITKFAGRLARWPTSAEIFLPGGYVPEPGARLVQADLAQSLRRLAKYGSDELRTGPTATALARFYAAAGGALTEADLAMQRPAWHEPLVTSFRGWTIHAATAPLGDAAFASGLKLLELWPPFAGPDDPDYVHVSIESAKLVARDRVQHIGDQTPPETIEWLLGNAHVAELRRQVGDRARAVPADATAADTITLCVIDATGNTVNLMQTVGQPFGTGAVAPGTGMLTNSSASFSYPGNRGLNDIRPGGKLEQNPCLLTVLDPAGRVRLVVGSPGGKTRVETVRQMLANVLDFGMDIQAAVDAPRFLRSPDGRTVTFEAAAGSPPAELVAALQARGHLVEVVDERFGTGQAVAVDPATGERLAAADWRLESAALAGP